MENLDGGQMEQDGSLDSAVANMPDITAGDPKPAAPRADNGRYAKADAAGEVVEDEVEAVETDDTEAVKAEEPDAEAEDDDDYVEIPGEEGQEPTRLSLSELLEAREKATKYEQELSEAKKAQPLPQDIEQALTATIQERIQYVNALQQWQAFNKPVEADRGLLDPVSPNYNPDLYYQQLQQADSIRAQHAQVQQEISRLQQQHEAQTEAIANSRRIRNREALLKQWPEIANPEVADSVRKGLSEHFGVDQETLNSIDDPRFYVLAKHALANIKSQTVKKEAVKATVAKPKLVRGKARSTSSPKQAQQQQAMGRLQKSGRLEDAADLMGKFL